MRSTSGTIAWAMATTSMPRSVGRTGASPGAAAGKHAHTVRNETQRDAVAFVVYAPGPQMEQFCRTAADLATRGDVDMTTVLRLAQQLGIEMLGPVPVEVA